MVVVVITSGSYSNKQGLAEYGDPTGHPQAARLSSGQRRSHRQRDGNNQQQQHRRASGPRRRVASWGRAALQVGPRSQSDKTLKKNTAQTNG